MNKKLRPIHASRLMKLALHLEFGKLGHERFNFSVFHKPASEPGPSCGTAGCALGECPVVFPADWKFVNKAETVWLKKAIKRDWVKSCGELRETPTTFKMAERFFGLTKSAVRHLFAPYQQCVREFGGHHLNNDATPASVASNIRAFLAIATLVRK